MIHNLRAYVITKLPTAVVVAQALTATSPVECALLTQTGGVPSHHVNRTDFTVQLMVRYNSLTIGSVRINEIYNVLKNIFHEELPAATVDSVVCPKLTAWQISPIQAPTYIGVDDNGRHLYSVNFIVTI